MAKAKEVTKAPKPPKRKFVLELNEKEAQLVMALVGKTVDLEGDGIGDSVYGALWELELFQFDVVLSPSDRPCNIAYRFQ